VRHGTIACLAYTRVLVGLLSTFTNWLHMIIKEEEATKRKLPVSVMNILSLETRKLQELYIEKYSADGGAYVYGTKKGWYILAKLLRRAIKYSTSDTKNKTIFSRAQTWLNKYGQEDVSY